MKIITINLEEHIVDLFSKIIELKYAPNRSDLIRRLIDYALPRYLGLIKTYEKMTKEIINPKFEKPKYKPPTIEELREMFPNLPDFKYINEKVIIKQCQ